MPAGSAAERSKLLEKAAASLSRGELDAALKHYVKAFDGDPRDWSVGNTLGDLYIRMGLGEDAVSHFTVLAEQLAADGFAAKARALYRKILRLQPANEAARQRVDELDRLQIGTASPFLKRVMETARTFRELPAAAPPAPPVPAPAPPTAPVPSFARAEALVNEALARGAYRDAASAIEQFVAFEPSHIGALEKLIDICVDGGFDAALVSAQQRLAEACLQAGELRRAFDIAVDLASREPDADAHRERLRRVAAAGRAAGQTFDILFLATVAAEPELAIPVAPSAPPPIARPEASPLAAPPLAAVPRRAEPPLAAVPPSAPPPAAPAAIVSEREIPVVASSPASVAIGPPFGDLLKAWGDLERLFEDTRQTLLDEAATSAEEAFAEGSRLLAARRAHDAIAPLDQAMCLPHLRASAGSRLARVYRDTGDAVSALETLEWVAELPPADEESGHELAYELALTLEALGQESQALGVYRELLAEVGPTYRDVATRAQKLTAA